MLKIAIGTNSTYKVHAIKKVLYELDIPFESFHAKADSGVREQPCLEGETQSGSIHRAKNILSQFPECDFGIGVEFGYEPDGETFHMVCWSTIFTRDGKTFSQHSSSLELPKDLVTALKHNVDVDSSLNLIFTKLSDSEASRLFKKYLHKRQVIYESVTNVLIRYLMDKEFY